MGNNMKKEKEQYDRYYRVWDDFQFVMVYILIWLHMLVSEIKRWGSFRPNLKFLSLNFNHSNLEDSEFVWNKTIWADIFAKRFVFSPSFSILCAYIES